MKTGFRQSMSSVHTWSGIVLCWILYFMFLTGTLGYFDDEIDRWMTPDTPANSQHSHSHLLNLAEQRLAIVAPDADLWWVGFPGRRQYEIWWNKNDPETGRARWKNETLDPETGQPIKTRDTGGGQVLYAMHYLLHYIPSIWGYIITTISGFFMFVALLTGVVIHKKIFKEFFTFRPKKKQRSWMDIHNIFSVLPLPYLLMITYTGIMILMFVSMSLVISANYGFGKENYDRFMDKAFEEHHVDSAGISSDNLPMSTVLADATQRWGKNIEAISIDNRGDVNAHIEVTKGSFSGPAHQPPKLTYNGVTGLFEENNDHSEPGSIAFYDYALGLHEGLFADTLLRWIFFFSGLMGAAMVGSGAILWTVKRRKKADKTNKRQIGLQIVEGLNIGTIAGLPIAIAAYFSANRLLPVDYEHRANWEVHSLFITWAVVSLYAFYQSKAPERIMRTWVELLGLAALSYCFIPILNAITTDRHLAMSLPQADWYMAGFDLTALSVGLLFLFAAYRIRKQLPNHQQRLLPTKQRLMTQHQ